MPDDQLSDPSGATDQGQDLESTPDREPARSAGRAERPSEGVVERVFEMVASFQSGPTANPLFSKMESKHVDQILELAVRDSEREHEFRLKRSTHTLWMLGAILVAVLLLCWLLLGYGDTESLENVLTAVLAFASGAGLGYGTGRYKAGTSG